jgi:translation initiation factor IF-2
MSEAKQMRLSKVAKEFNLSLGKITEFLASKGRPVENNPNAKIGDEEYSLLSKEFSGDKSAKEEAQHIGSTSLKMKRESIVLEDPKVIRAREEEQKQKAIANAAALKIEEEKAEAEIKAAAKKALEIHITPLEETPEIKENTSLVNGPKVLGTVDLSSINSKTKPDKKSKKEKESEVKSEPIKNTSKDKKEVVEEPIIIEQPVAEEEKITPSE